MGSRQQFWMLQELLPQVIAASLREDSNKQCKTVSNPSYMARSLNFRSSSVGNVESTAEHVGKTWGEGGGDGVGVVLVPALSR